MSLFTIGDLHLSLSCDKPMDIFKGWSDYVDKIRENWISLFSENYNVVIPGDISWGMTLEQSSADFAFINNVLRGKKIILKGNHDYWWNTLSKMNNFLLENNFSNIKILSNNSFSVEGIAVCGSRGWINETEEPADVKVLKREAIRLEMSIKEGIRSGGEIVVFIHYPPIYGEEENYYILEVLEKYEIKRVYYGHVHGSAVNKAFRGVRRGTEYVLVSADAVGFVPQRVEPAAVKYACGE
jgi:predicted phosphohydrolase